MISRVAIALVVCAISAFLVAGEDASAGPPPGTTIPIGSTHITGQAGNILVVTIAPDGGGEALGRVCFPLEDPITNLAQTNFTDVPLDQNPCGDPTPDTLFAPGDYTVTAGVFEPGSQTPLRSVQLPVSDSNGSTPLIDGAVLSAFVTGDTDCDGDIDAVDALNVLKKIAAIAPLADCVDQAGNVKCDDSLASTDALFILRFKAALANNFPAGCDPLFEAPSVTAPEDGTVFTNFPRDFDVEWDPVPGASSYIVEVDCRHCCIIGEYCADVGRGYRSFVAAGVTSTAASVSGDNEFRLRVWAVGDNGHPGLPTDWLSFEFDT